MSNAMYDTLVAAISDYLGKHIQLGVNASHFFNNGCFIIRLWSEDGNFVWVAIPTRNPPVSTWRKASSQ